MCLHMSVKIDVGVRMHKYFHVAHNILKDRQHLVYSAEAATVVRPSNLFVGLSSGSRQF